MADLHSHELFARRRETACEVLRAGAFNVMVANIEEQMRVLANLIEEADVAADASVPDIRAGPLSRSQAWMARILRQQAQMAVYLAPLLGREAAVRPEELLGSLQLHRARSRLALVVCV